jgi:hypothetical protein
MRTATNTWPILSAGTTPNGTSCGPFLAKDGNTTVLVQATTGKSQSPLLPHCPLRQPRRRSNHLRQHHRLVQWHIYESLCDDHNTARWSEYGCTLHALCAPFVQYASVTGTPLSIHMYPAVSGLAELSLVYVTPTISMLGISGASSLDIQLSNYTQTAAGVDPYYMAVSEKGYWVDTQLQGVGTVVYAWPMNLLGPPFTVDDYSTCVGGKYTVQVGATTVVSTRRSVITYVLCLYYRWTVLAWRRTSRIWRRATTR